MKRGFFRRPKDESPKQRHLENGHLYAPVTPPASIANNKAPISPSESADLKPEVSPPPAQDVPYRSSRLLNIENKSREPSRSPSRDYRNDPKGLTVLYEPQHAPVADIVFVHGLGGTSHHTWAKNHNLDLFWPREWLPQERDLCNARMLTFGYNTRYGSYSSKDTVLNISDFAHDLLFDLKLAKGQDQEELRIGSIPLIFVAHSLGGLVVKQAFLLGQHDENFKEIVRAMSGIIFLSTPHHGSNYAETLNRVLSACIFALAPKLYIKDLQSDSRTINEINDQFRHHTKTLNLASFFETLPTTIVGLAKIQILQRDSAVLGSPDEMSKALEADHHGVCKFDDTYDPNYVSVKNMLHYLLRNCRSQKPDQSGHNVSDEIRQISEILDNASEPLDDLDHFLEKRMAGSCEWVLQTHSFTSLMNDTSLKPHILWCSGKPGSGKSVLAAFIVDHLRTHLQTTGHKPAFYFFRFGDENKRNLNLFLMSIAYQIASFVPEYRRKLLKLVEGGCNLHRSAPRLIWQRLFDSLLLKSSISQPIYLVIDALDECEASTVLLQLFADMASSKVPLRIVIVSRQNQQSVSAMEKLSRVVSTTKLSLDNEDTDLGLYVHEEIMHMLGDSVFRQSIATRVLKKAAGNFLWVHLVLKNLTQSHTHGMVEEALSRVPDDLESLYQRMDAQLANNLSEADRVLGRKILMWVVYSHHSLSLKQLSEALKPERLLDISSTIRHVCGDFVVIDHHGYVAIVHASAREVLIKNSSLHFHLPAEEGHLQMYTKCLTTLLTAGLRARMPQVDPQSFLSYATLSWAHHLDHSHAISDHESLSLLAKFVRTNAMLTWIYLLLISRNMRVIIHTSKAMTDYLKRIDKLDADRSPLTHLLREKEVVSLWATDLVRLVGRFSNVLLQHPKLIFKSIAPFCPQRSIMYRQFASRAPETALTVSGLTNTAWDDCLAKFTIDMRHTPTKIMCTTRFFAILMSNGSVKLYYCATHEEVRHFQHGERVLTWCFSCRGDRIATYGLRMTRVWSTSSGKRLHQIINPPRAKALAISFTGDDSALLTCSDDRLIRKAILTEEQQGWVEFEDALGQDRFGGRQANSPRQAVFSPDATQLAVTFRGLPIAVWNVEDSPPRLLARCQSLGDRGRHDPSEQGSYTTAQFMSWNPITGHIIGIYDDGRVFRWSPDDDDLQESRITATNIKCSIDGKFFVTSSIGGALRIWDFYYFSPIYLLSCTTPAKDLAIDNEDSRVYDIRDDSCCIWEPNALVKLWDADERSSETQSAIGSSTQFSIFSETSVEMLEPITALAIRPDSFDYSIGNEDGVVWLFGGDGQHLTEVSQCFMTIQQLCWSLDGSHIASADLSRRIVIKKIEEVKGSVFASPVLTMKEETQIQQLVLSSGAGFLIVSSDRFVNVWSLSKKAIISTLPVVEPIRWRTHPTNSSLVFGASYSHLHLLSWDSPGPISSAFIDRTAIDVEENTSPLDSIRRRPSATYPMGPSPEIESVVDQMLISMDGSIALIETSKISAQEDFPSDAKTTPTIQPRPLPPDLLAQLEVPLGFVSGNPMHAVQRRLSIQSNGATSSGLSPSESILAFLSHDFWLCTYALSETKPGRVKRHTFLPMDWIDMDMLELAIMRSDGTLFCPRNGEIAILKNALREEWVD